MTIAQKIEELKKDISNHDSNLWEKDYGCDGMNDDCCGNCGGIDIKEDELINRIDDIRQSFLVLQSVKVLQALRDKPNK